VVLKHVTVTPFGGTTTHCDVQDGCQPALQCIGGCWSNNRKELFMKLYVQPGDGLMPVVKAINAAKSSVELLVFRFDRSEIEHALAAAVTRGVAVQALIAHTSRAGEQALRQLEMRLLSAGVTVTRTAGDLTRYHGKMMIIDRRELWVFTFNYTHLDIERSRSFALVTTQASLVREAVRLFECDAKRRPYEADCAGFVVSPSNARAELSAFIKGAKSKLLIYDPTISDPAIHRLLEERAKAGVDVRVLGVVALRSNKLSVNKPALRLHARAMVRDGTHFFLGSQSLRRMELESRREIGIICHDNRIAKRMAKIFEEDWSQCEDAKAPDHKDESETSAKVAKKVAKAVAKELPPVAPVLKMVIRELTGDKNAVDLSAEEVEDTVRHAVKAAVKDVVRNAMEETDVEKDEQPEEELAEKP
jgi:phosphatidylserine/phosphatidylglycerophosphate/cardiolipin synthase-like enzyme